MAGGVFFFGFFIWDKQQKEPRQSGETDIKSFAAVHVAILLLEELDQEIN